ncbi:uncharacterized protein LOC9642340 [Selaginella moellendorffii]|uniref:uncharacterized protein LOC9642340 n=1 Tax=Selaginella moellendorffii TaxID=88036 RepID=UPI000D1CF07E|nr:uncharacterized protein LOC9642340 [Selaginella moellendorffii]|eukprot:XP_024531625.1 uncharacterized protein LOC9642340 [Selaginella moellendorffii]
MAERKPWKTSSIVAIAVFIFAIVIATAVLLVFSLCVNKKKPEGEFYSDLIKQTGTTCWETNVFATTNDPFYKWATSTSIASALVWGETKNSSSVSMTEVAAAYQKLSAWRVWRSNNKTVEADLFNSPDPHLYGGVIRQHGTSLIWKMAIHWGISLRLCINDMSDMGASAVERCKITAPIVSVNKTSGTPDLGLLLSKVPFAMPSSKFTHPVLTKSGFYFSNFASSARSNISTGISQEKIPSNDSTWSYYSNDIRECSPSVPINYIPDVISYLSYPFLECACRRQVCIIGYDLTQGQDVSFAFNTSQCETSRSFWDWDHIIDEHIIYLGSYSIKFNLPVTVLISFNDSLPIGASLASLTEGVLSGMEQMTTCIETTLEGDQEPNPTVLFDACIKNVTGSQVMLITGIKYKYSRMQTDKVCGTVIKEFLLTKKPGGNITCGNEEFKVDSPPCFKKLSAYDNMNVQEVLNDLLKVSNVHHFGKQYWKDGSSRRTQVYASFLTFVIAFLGICAGSLSRTLLEWEDSLFRQLHQLKLAGKPGYRPLIRTLGRTVFIAGSVAGSLPGLYFSINDLQKEPSLATAETILQLNNDTAFLVTTTSTVEVTPNWIVFQVFTVFIGLAVVALAILIYFKLEKNLRQTTHGTRKRQRGPWRWSGR